MAAVVHLTVSRFTKNGLYNICRQLVLNMLIAISAEDILIFFSFFPENRFNHFKAYLIGFTISCKLLIYMKYQSLIIGKKNEKNIDLSYAELV